MSSHMFIFLTIKAFFVIQSHFNQIDWPHARADCLGCVFWSNLNIYLIFKKHERTLYKIIDYFCQVTGIFFIAVLFRLFVDHWCCYENLWTIDTVDMICCPIKETNISFLSFIGDKNTKECFGYRKWKHLELIPKYRKKSLLSFLLLLLLMW